LTLGHSAVEITAMGNSSPDGDLWAPRTKFGSPQNGSMEDGTPHQYLRRPRFLTAFGRLDRSWRGGLEFLCGRQHPFATYGVGTLPLDDGQRKARQHSSQYCAIGRQRERPSAAQFK